METSVGKPSLGLYYELTNVLRNIIFDMGAVDKKVTELEMRWNPKPYVPPSPSPMKRSHSQKASPTRNYYPPGYMGNQ